MKRFVVIVECCCAAVCAYASPIPGPDLHQPRERDPAQLQRRSLAERLPLHPRYLTGYGPDPAMCDDYMHGGSTGDIWEANITNLGTNNLTLTRFGFEEAALGLVSYREAAWILLQTPVAPTSQYAGHELCGVAHLRSDAPLDAGAREWLDVARAEAATGYPGVPFNDVFIITPVDQYDPIPTTPRSF